MPIRKVDQHVRLQNNGLLTGGERGFVVDNSDRGVDNWIQSIDLYDRRVEIRHL